MEPALTVLLKILQFVFVYFTRAVLFIATSPNYFRKPQRCPKISDNLLLVPAHTLAAMIRRREVSSETIVKSYISRIQEVNPVLNAVVEDRYDFAVRDARIVDTMLSTTNLPMDELERKYPLLGVPLTVKECIPVEGCSHSAGLVVLKYHKAKKDAPAVKLCKEAGAIVIAVTNTPEYCSYLETYNYVTGVTRNPYDTRYTAGGSSGGEGALLGAAASVIGLASDLIGSIRLPAHFCGVWGHKPSADVISSEDHIPYCESNPIFLNTFTMGPMVRYASDLSLLMQVLQKRPLQSLKRIKVPLEDIKLYYMVDDTGSSLSHAVDQEIVDAIRNLIEKFSKKSYCEKVQIDEFKKFEDYAYPLLATFINDMDTPFDTSNYLKELLQYFTYRSKYTIMSILLMIAIQIKPQIEDSRIKKCLQGLEKMKREICLILGENGVLIFPTHPTPATFHNQHFAKFNDYRYTCIFSLLGLPVTQCPIGFTSQGLPIGIQVVGIPDNDGLTIAVAEEIEQELGGWVLPQSI